MRSQMTEGCNIWLCFRCWQCLWLDKKKSYSVMNYHKINLFYFLGRKIKILNFLENYYCQINETTESSGGHMSPEIKNI